MAKSLLMTSRLWHRKIASLLFIFFFLVSLTGIMLGSKYLFTKNIFDNKKIKPANSLVSWLPLDSLEKIATHSLNEKTNNTFDHAENIQLRPIKGYINFSFKNNYNIQVDGATGATIHIEQKNGGLIQDIHDGAIVGDWFNLKAGLTKTIYSTIMGLALLLLTLSGFWMWWKPKQIKKSKLIIAFFCIFAIEASAQVGSDFIAKPYLQVGADRSATSLHLLWHATGDAASWLAEYKTTGKWMKAEKITSAAITTAGLEPYSVFNAAFTGLQSGTLFMYRVSKAGKVIFNSEGKAPKSADQPYRFVASGDMGAGTKEAKQIANGIYKANPDLVAIAGDIVYEYGLIREYKTKYWPIYNADKVDTIGVPLLRSTPVIAALGNHDADNRDLDKQPDALAYYLFFDQPLNGPVGKEGGAFTPLLRGSDANKKAFTDAAGERYPRMANFSYNYGNAHWTVIDADTYVDWTDSSLTKWVADDLAASKDAVWHFVLFHHPGFSSSREHFEQQQMRLLAPVFEKGKVDIVFNGHVHNYQRTFPMQFVPDRKGALIVGGRDNKTVRGRVVMGKWTLDKSFDGKTNTKANGVIYIVSGAGGQTLYNPEQQADPDTWQKFTVKFVSTIHSFTVVDVNGKNLKLKQVDVNGKEVDAIEINK